MKIKFTNHARRVMAEREIQIEWIERALGAPGLKEPDPNDPEIERFFVPSPNSTTGCSAWPSTRRLIRGG